MVYIPHHISGKTLSLSYQILREGWSWTYAGSRYMYKMYICFIYRQKPPTLKKTVTVMSRHDEYYLTPKSTKTIFSCPRTR